MRRARGPRYPDRFNGTTKYTAWAVFEAGHAAGKDLDRRRGPLIQTRFGGRDYADAVAGSASTDDAEDGISRFFPWVPTNANRRPMRGGDWQPRLLIFQSLG